VRALGAWVVSFVVVVVVVDVVVVVVVVAVAFRHAPSSCTAFE
jgi:hypothetical protein